jgi:hypothetical protein
MSKIIPGEEQVFMASSDVDTSYGGSVSLQQTQEWYTMQDVIDTVKPYKIYTAILNQEGVDNEIQIGAGGLAVGTTYRIKQGGPGTIGDFTNVGAPNNDEGTIFVATGEIPNSWGTSALVYNVGAPTAIVLENTIGNIWFSYKDVGQYNINSVGLFTPTEKTTIFTGPSTQANIVIFASDIGYNSMLIGTAKSGDNSDNQLINTVIEIRVYN